MLPLSKGHFANVDRMIWSKGYPYYNVLVAYYIYCIVVCSVYNGIVIGHGSIDI